MNQNKFKKIYLTILSIVTILAVLGGSIYHFTNWFSDWGWDLPFGEDSNHERYISMISIQDSFTDLEVNADNGRIVLQYGDEAEISYDYVGKKDPKIECKDGKLIVTAQTAKEVKSLMDLDESSEIVITIPKGTTLENCKVTADLGDVELNDVNIKNLTVEAAMGNFTAEKGQLDYVSAEVNMGNLELTNVTIQDCDLEVDMGNCEVSGDIYGVTADVAMGNLEVHSSQDADDMNLNLDCAMGNCTVNGSDY